MPANPVRRRVASTVRGLFAHVERQPLESTFEYPGDPGLFGPDTITWKVQRHHSVFVGAPRALIVQACHPEVLAGVIDHSRYERDPLGRLSRTSAYVTTTVFGSVPEVEEAVATVQRAHERVRGFSWRGIPYSADHPALAAWVHNALVSSFLVAYQTFGPGLSPVEADRYVWEQTRVGRLLDADPLPETADDLHAYVADHPGLEGSPQLDRVMSFLRRPPLSAGVLLGYRALFEAAITTLPEGLRRVSGVDPLPGARLAGQTMVAGLAWALRESPAYQAALKRIGLGQAA